MLKRGEREHGIDMMMARLACCSAAAIVCRLTTTAKGEKELEPRFSSYITLPFDFVRVLSYFTRSSSNVQHLDFPNISEEKNY